MFDIYVNDMNLTSLTLLLSVVVVFPVQLLLCWKVKNRVLRLLPVLVFGVCLAVAVAAGLIIDGWDSLGYMLIGLHFLIPLFVCGCTWAVWYLDRAVKARLKRASNG